MIAATMPSQHEYAVAHLDAWLDTMRGPGGSTLAQWRPRRYPRLQQAMLAVGIATFAVLAVFKATNEPLLSNKWTFYQQEELAAITWGDTHSPPYRDRPIG